MEKKEMKWYETPAMEVLDMHVEGFFCASSNADNAEVETPEESDNPLF